MKQMMGRLGLKLNLPTILLMFKCVNHSQFRSVDFHDESAGYPFRCSPNKRYL